MRLDEPSVRSYRQLSNQLTEAMQRRTRPSVKTHLVEVLVAIDRDSTADLIRRSLRRALPRRQVVAIPLPDAQEIFEVRANRLSVWVDTSDARMWEVHSLDETNAFTTLVERWVTLTPELDLPWYPEELLARASKVGAFVGFGLLFSREFFAAPDEAADTLSVRVSGSESEDALGDLRGQRTLTRTSALSSVRIRNPLSGPGAMAAGRITSSLNARGRVSSRGDTFERHRAFLGHSAQLYRDAAAAITATMSVGALEASGEGLRGPAVIEMGSEIGDLAGFCGRLFSGAEPFALWGFLERRSENLIVAQAFDRRSGHRFTVEAMPSKWRVYLPAGTPGSIVLRLLTLLQRHHDRRTTLVDLPN
jgi:hypothetical protein